MTNILVVDPNEAFSTLLTEELRRQDYEVEAAYSYQDAVAIADERPVDLALLDMGLDEPGAMELAQVLRSKRPAVRLMFIPLMGENLPTEVGESLFIQGVLPKPFFLPELPERINAALTAPLEPGGKSEVVAVVPQLEPESTAIADAPTMITERAPLKVQEVGRFSLRRVTQHRSEIARELQSLVQEVTADAVLLTVADQLATWVGRLEEEAAAEISRVVTESWVASTILGRVLGREEEQRFELSLSGGDYMLYALAVDGNTILSVVIRGGSSLGLLRHRTREIADEIALICR